MYRARLTPAPNVDDDNGDAAWQQSMYAQDQKDMRMQYFLNSESEWEKYQTDATENESDSNEDVRARKQRMRRDDSPRSDETYEVEREDGACSTEFSPISPQDSPTSPQDAPQNDAAGSNETQIEKCGHVRKDYELSRKRFEDKKAEREDSTNKTT